MALSPSRRFSCSSTESSGKQCAAISRLVPGAVAEALRFEPSVASVSRFALEDIELDGYVLNAGQFMTLSTMSAMRDEKVFEAPQPSTFLEPTDSADISCSAVAPIDASVRRLPRRS